MRVGTIWFGSGMVWLVKAVSVWCIKVGSGWARSGKAVMSLQSEARCVEAVN